METAVLLWYVFTFFNINKTKNIIFRLHMLWINGAPSGITKQTKGNCDSRSSLKLILNYQFNWRMKDSTQDILESIEVSGNWNVFDCQLLGHICCYFPHILADMWQEFKNIMQPQKDIIRKMGRGLPWWVSWDGDSVMNTEKTWFTMMQSTGAISRKYWK